MRKCPNCGSELSIDNVVCIPDGGGHTDDKLYCPNCDWYTWLVCDEDYEGLD